MLERNEDAKSAVSSVSKMLNNFSFNPKYFVEEMSREHRTLQQSFTRLCLSWIVHCSKLKEYEYDGRNEASVKLCKSIVDAIGEENISLPFI